VKYEQVARLPKFDAGQYEGCDFGLSGGDARLRYGVRSCRLSKLSHHTSWHQFTALPNCDVGFVRNAYFRPVEVVESPALSSFIEADGALRKAYQQLRHYRIFLDETGCHEVFAERAFATTAIDALSLDDSRRRASLQHAYGSAGVRLWITTQRRVPASREPRVFLRSPFCSALQSGLAVGNSLPI